jgi:hypothetical protein
VEEFEIPFSLLEKEILEGCEFIYFLNLSWLAGYFKKVSVPMKVFYSDEYYISGRIISAAANLAANKNIVTYGVQHGLLLENHTVYRISDLELAKLNSDGDELPRPDHFIAWGEYFRDLFLSANSLDKNYVLVAGNLKYCLIHQRGLYLAKKENNKKKLLWCTTIPNYFKAEYAIVEPVLKQLENYELSFRLHPVRHISREQIEDWVSREILSHASFSTEPDIFRDISNHDLVISTAFSTTFFDGLIMGKKTCRIFTGISKADFSHTIIMNLYDVKTSGDFQKIFDSFSDPSYNISTIKIDSLCYLKDDVWTKTLTHD